MKFPELDKVKSLYYICNMGWITKRNRERGKGFGGFNDKSREKCKYPLRSIVSLVMPADGMFGRSRVLLECGHEVLSNGMSKARCRACYVEMSKGELVEKE